jgi:SAM-dependent methyltransferase
MSGFIVKKFWHLGDYAYPFYRFVLEDLCWQYFKKSGITMLDAGCGPNVSSLSHVPDNISFIGLDVNLENVAKSHRKAKTKGFRNFSFIVASITDLPFCNKSFDLVLCQDVLEHIKTKQKALNEISRVSKPQGKLVGSTSNLFNPLMMLDALLPSKISFILTRKFAGEHYYERNGRFTVPGLFKALSEADFKKCHIELLGFPAFQPWIYEFSDKKPPWFAFLWIAFDKITNRVHLRLIKETMVFLASEVDSKDHRPPDRMGSKT